MSRNVEFRKFDGLSKRKVEKCRKCLVLKLFDGLSRKVEKGQEMQKMSSFENLWRCLELCGAGWRCLELCGAGWRCLELCGAGWRCLELFRAGWRCCSFGLVPIGDFDITRRYATRREMSLWFKIPPGGRY